MQESQRSQPGNPRNVSPLMDDWVRICNTCGDVGDESLLVSCNKCIDGAAHTYCMCVKRLEKPKRWTCEECAPREGTDKLMEEKVKAAARRKKGAKRHGVLLEAPTALKARDIETRAVSSKSLEPCKNSLLSEDFSCEESERVKTKSVNDNVYSFPPTSCISQEKRKVPCASGYRKRISTLAQLEEKRKALETTIISRETSNIHNHSPLGREPPSKKLGKANLGAAGTSLKPSSYGLGDGSPNLDSQTDVAQNKCKTGSLSAGSLLKSNSSKAANLKPKEQLAKAGCLQKQKVERSPAFHDDRKRKDPIMVSMSMTSERAHLKKTNATGSKVVIADDYKPNNPPLCLLSSDSAVTAEKNDKETISGGENLFSGSRICNLDAVRSSQLLDHRSQPSVHNTRKNLNFTNEKKKNVSWQAEHPPKAAAAMSMFKLCTGPASDEWSDLRGLAQVEAATLSQGLIIPNAHHSWIGKFLIRKSEKIARTFDGFQAHLSSCASLKVHEVVDRFPEIIILDELPRLRIWPSQFMERQVTEEDIALCFFAKDVNSYNTCYRRLLSYMINNDLALKGNLDGVELLVFPSNILPERSQRWNQLFFLWGVFKAQKMNNSANTSVSNSLKKRNGDTVKRVDN